MKPHDEHRLGNTPYPCSSVFIGGSKFYWTAILLLPAVGLWGETKITELKLRVEPAEARARPFETVTVQVLVYGTAGEKKGRLQSADWQIRLREEGGGWLSKPFKFQGDDRETFVEERENSILNILNRGVGQFTVKDTVLYTAPEKAGRYTVEVTSGSLRAETAIEVTAEAASRLTAEKTSFGPEPSAGDPHRGLAEHYAPFVAQETLDPAYAVSVNLKFPPALPVSLEYTFNPYLDVAGTPEPVRAAASPVSETLAPKVKEGTCEWEARLDGSVVVTIRGDQAEYQELSGQPVAGPTLRCGAPRDCRDWRLDDSKGGADRCRVTNRWKR